MSKWRGNSHKRLLKCKRDEIHAVVTMLLWNVDGRSYLQNQIQRGWRPWKPALDSYFSRGGGYWLRHKDPWIKKVLYSLARDVGSIPTSEAISVAGE